MPAITTNGVTLYYEAYGKLSDGGTVFLIPGLGMQHWMWPDTLIETLVKGGAGVVVMDNRDCGRSSRCSGRVSMGRVFGSIGRTLTRRPVSGVYGLEEMASDVVGLASGLGIRTFHAAGISIGRHDCPGACGPVSGIGAEPYIDVLRDRQSPDRARQVFRDLGHDQTAVAAGE